MKTNSFKICVIVFLWTASLLGTILLTRSIPLFVLEAPAPSLVKTFNNLVYDGVATGAIRTTVFEGRPQLIGFMDLSMRFRIHRFSPGSIVFETAPGNRGISVELLSRSEDSGLVKTDLIVGEYTRRQQIKRMPLDQGLEVGKEYTLGIKIDPWGNLSAFLNGEFLTTLKNIRPTLATFVIGSGSNGSGAFLGNVYLDRLSISIDATAADMDRKGSGLSMFAASWQPRDTFRALGLFLFLVNIVTSLRIFYYMWYEP